MPDWHAAGRERLQALGLDPRYARRARWISKAKAVRSVGASVRANLPYVLLDPEPHNYTYDIANTDELVAWAAAAASEEPPAVRDHFAELQADPELRNRLHAVTRRHRLWSKPQPPFGRRAGWYLLARALNPQLIIETGVHDGLGSLLLLRALERNQAEGHPGRLVSFDINPAAGWLVGEHPAWTLRLESTRDGLAGVLDQNPGVGLFIHDSLHTYEHEYFELSTAAPRLASGGVLVSDNVHVTTALRDVCAEHGMPYREFREVPAGHFYPGSAMGAGSR
jgi:predicted O-methyltransferase YrrM